MIVKINEKWKAEIKDEITALKIKVNNLFEEQLKNIGDMAIEGKLSFYKRELAYLEGKLDTIELIEQGCFVEIVKDDINNEIINEVGAYV